MHKSLGLYICEKAKEGHEFSLLVGNTSRYDLGKKEGIKIFVDEEQILQYKKELISYVIMFRSLEDEDGKSKAREEIIAKIDGVIFDLAVYCRLNNVKAEIHLKEMGVPEGYGFTRVYPLH